MLISYAVEEQSLTMFVLPQWLAFAFGLDNARRWYRIQVPARTGY